MASTLGGQTIYIVRDSDWQTRPTYGEIDAIGATSTTLHYGGTPSPTRTIEFWIFDDGVNDALDALAAASAAVNLTTHHIGNEGNVQIIEYLPEIRHANNYDYPIYRATARLMKR